MARASILAAMSDADSFGSLCERLRKIGLVKIEGHGYSAVFDLSHRASTAETAPVAPAKSSKRVNTPSAEALREQLFARELGNT